MRRYTTKLCCFDASIDAIASKIQLLVLLVRGRSEFRRKGGVTQGPHGNLHEHLHNLTYTYRLHTATTSTKTTPNRLLSPSRITHTKAQQQMPAHPSSPPKTKNKDVLLPLNPLHPTLAIAGSPTALAAGPSPPARAHVGTQIHAQLEAACLRGGASTNRASRSGGWK